MRFFFILISFAVCIHAMAQSTKKPPAQKPPTQKEMEEIQKELDGLTDEEKKEMEKMGIKMPDLKSLQKTMNSAGNAQMKKAFEDDDRIVPAKDNARIAKALSVNLTNAAMPAYLQQVHSAVLATLPADVKIIAQQIQHSALSQKKSLAQTAIGLWVDGKPSIAIYLAGTAVQENPADGNNLNNYAAMLTMCGAEQAAIPVLNYLNKTYPKNSTVLSNMAQAWLGLGDVDRAGKYADSTIRIAAAHPQANMVKCLVEQSKGNTPGAIAAAKKAIQKSFSTQKQNKLESLGSPVKPGDLSWDKPMPQDPMGLEKFTWPGYPMTVEQSMVLELRWNAFKEAGAARLEELRSKLEKVQEQWQQAKEYRGQLAMQGLPNEQAMPYPLGGIKAMLKLAPLVEAENGANMSFVFGTAYQQLIETTTEKLEALQKLRETKSAAFSKKYEKQFGEGLANPYQAACSEENDIRNNYLSAANKVLEEANNNFIKIYRRKASDHLYYIQWAMWPEDFEMAKLNAQIAWLEFITRQQVVFFDRSGYCNITADKQQENASLQNFDDVACKYKSTMDLGIFSITQECSNLITKWDFAGVKLDMKDNIETNKLNGTLIVGVSKGFDGPMSTEVTVSGGALVEFDNTGITDIGAIAGMEASVAGQTIGGAEATFTINSGTSVAGKGILQGINY